jgi:cell wall-associated NlpC family hydrolase
MAAVGCASSGARPRPFPGGPESPEPTVPVVSAAIVDNAMSLRGRPYRNGGSDPSGFDCSGLVQYVFGQEGVKVPREVREQVRLGREVRLAGIRAGDLIFFAINGRDVSHVGISIGGDEFIHAPSSRGVVRVEKFSAVYWSSRIVAIRRVEP